MLIMNLFWKKMRVIFYVCTITQKAYTLFQKKAVQRFLPRKLIDSDVLNIPSSKESVYICFNQGNRNNIVDFLLICSNIGLYARSLKNPLFSVHLVLKNSDVDPFTICSCVQLIDYPVTFVYEWNQGPPQKTEPLIGLYRYTRLVENCPATSGEKEESDDIRILLNPDYTTPDSLSIPLSYSNWAKGFLKSFDPLQKFIVMDLPYPAPGQELAWLSDWNKFFTHMLMDHPLIHFILINQAEDQTAGMISGTPNITSTKRQGCSLLQEFALVRESDMYIGGANEYGLMILGMDKPFIIDTSDSHLEWIDQWKREGTRNTTIPWQILTDKGIKTSDVSEWFKSNKLDDQSWGLL